MHAGSWYIDDLHVAVDTDMKTGDDLPHSDAFTINGEPGDFCACSKGMFIRFWNTPELMHLASSFDHFFTALRFVRC
jgi:hypothetical protein